MNTQNLVAIDTHVHIESNTGNAADQAARKYFGEKGARATPQELADYYRERRIGCVVFSVDERLTGRPQVPNDDVAALAEKNSDIMLAFASGDPTRGPEAVTEARRLVARGCPKPLADALAVAWAAHVVTVPLVAAISGRVSLVGAFANLAVAAVIAVHMDFGKLCLNFAGTPRPKGKKIAVLGLCAPWRSQICKPQSFNVLKRKPLDK